MQINFLTQPLDNNPIKTEFVEKSDKVQSKTKPKSLETKSSESEPVQDDNLKNLQNSLAEHNITLKFRQDEQTKQLVVELVDNKTGESIRQFPSEVSLKLSQMSIKIQGQFVDDQV
jgi:uncharacterized FlaG/YvyC family protein